MTRKYIGDRAPKPRPKVLPIIEALRLKRKEAGVTQLRLSLLIGYSWHSIRNWERGRTMPTAASLVDYANGLGFGFLIVPREEANVDYVTQSRRKAGVRERRSDGSYFLRSDNQ